MNPKKALRKFLDHVERSNPRDLFEVGLTWDDRNGWRVYQRIGDKALAMGPAEARRLADHYDKLGATPQWQEVARGLVDTLGSLRTMADEADQKNISKEIPPGYVGLTPAMGRA